MAAAPTLSLPARLDPRAVLRSPETRTLASGLEVLVLPWRRAPVVATALVYRAGTRDEAPGHGGTAHFLEHMMFKGAERFGPGRIDAVTRALGGSNNAYTTHDATLYYFTFAADRWVTALELESDRMEGLLLEEREVDAERRVIREEIAMYEGEAWDALDEASNAAFFGDHAYGRPVLGDRASLERIDGDVLGAFHRRFYRPSNAVLAVVGDVDPAAAFATAESHFADLDDAPPPVRGLDAPEIPDGPRRVERRQGEVARFLLSLPSPDGDDPDHPVLRLLLTILASGRASRLHRALVDEGELCTWASADARETLDAGCLSVACEVLPGVDPRRVEEEVLTLLGELCRRPPSADEVERARQIVISDWVSGLEKVENTAFTLASARALWDLDHPWRYLERIRKAGAGDLLRVARRCLDVEAGSVLAWSLPKNGAERSP